MIRAALKLAAVGVLVLATGGTAGALPLDAAACDDLKAEQTRLKDAGVAADRDRGAEWGRSNLPAERIREIGRLIDVDANLAFRCARGPLPKFKATAAKSPTETTPAVGAKPQPDATAPPPSAPSQAVAAPSASAPQAPGQPADRGYGGVRNSLKQVSDDAKAPANAGPASPQVTPSKGAP